MNVQFLKRLTGQPAKEENAEKNALIANLEEAKAELFRAEQEFKMASSEMIDLCTYRLKTARERCNYLLRLAKELQ